jgi:hypothetical protein
MSAATIATPGPGVSRDRVAGISRRRAGVCVKAPAARIVAARPSRRVQRLRNIRQHLPATEASDVLMAGPMFGGARVGLPWGSLFVDIGA